MDRAWTTSRLSSALGQCRAVRRTPWQTLDPSILQIPHVSVGDAERGTWVSFSAFPEPLERIQHQPLYRVSMVAVESTLIDAM